MKRTFKHLLAGAIVISAAQSSHAQYIAPPPTQPFPGFLNDYLRRENPYAAQWDIGGSARLRYEARDGALGLPPGNDFRDHTTSTTENENDYLGMKLLAHVALTQKWWGFYVEGRSSETWGDDRSPTGVGPMPGPGGGNGPEQDGPVDLHQAYVTLGNHKEFPLSLKVGRQELSYGDERLVGAFGWNNIGRVFDAVKLRWQNSWFAVDAFTSKLVLPVDEKFNLWNDYNLFSGVYLTTKKIPKNSVEVYFLARNDALGSANATEGAVLPFQVPSPPGPAERDIYTFGARIKSNPGEFGHFDYTVEGAYQVGDWRQTATSEELDHQAYAFMANLGYTIGESSLTPRVAIEYALGSGDSDPNDGKHETFDNLYPTNHKFYGYMDFFSWQNLHDVRPIFTIKPTPRLSLALEGHLFWAATTEDNIYNAGGVPRGGGATHGTAFGRNPGYDSFLGSELDFIAGYALNKFSSLEAGYGHFFSGRYMDQTWSASGFGSRDADWVYVQGSIRF